MLPISLYRDKIKEGKVVLVLAIFYGIIIRMFFTSSEHNPPHIHAEYGEYGVSISISNCEILQGKFPKKAYKLVCEWVEIHRKELLDMWNNQEFRKLPPLE